MLGIPIVFWCWEPVFLLEVLRFGRFDQAACIMSSIVRVSPVVGAMWSPVYRFNILHLFWCQNSESGYLRAPFKSVGTVSKFVQVDGYLTIGQDD